MADNFIYIPLLNPVKFYDAAQTSDDIYFTKHFDQYKFSERLYDWHSRADYHQLWQTTDTIYLQFESNFSPINVYLQNCDGHNVIELPAIAGLANKYLAGVYAFEVSMSLATVPEGCYRIKITAGSGDGMKTFYSDCMHITTELVPNTVLLQYRNTRFHQDVVFETGIEFQLRLHGWISWLDPNRKDEAYRDEKYNPTILSSKSFRQFTAVFGDEYGLPDDIIDLLNRVWSCNSVKIDGKSFCVSEGGKFEFVTVEGYPKRGVSLKVEEGINRFSLAFGADIDPTKKLVHNIVVDAKVFGDLSNSGSSNEVPIVKVKTTE